MILVHAENGDLIAQVSGLNSQPFYLSLLLLVVKVMRRGRGGINQPGHQAVKGQAKNRMACQTLGVSHSHTVRAVVLGRP